VSDEQNTPALQLGWVTRLEPVELAGGEVRWSLEIEFPGPAEACGETLMRVSRGEAYSALPLPAEAVDRLRQAQADGTLISYAITGARATPWSGFRRVANDKRQDTP
jgi:hypothetical protein